MIERYFDEELKLLSEKILSMGSLVETMVNSAVKGFKERNIELLKKVLEDEKQVNLLHIEIDEQCLKLIALRQPMAGDLRFITAGMKINSNLERMGDQAVNISENAMMLFNQPAAKLLPSIEIMVEIVKIMVHDALDAFVRRDTKLAKKVLMQDDEVDNLKAGIFKELIANINTADMQDVNRSFDLILISRNLEKVADHTTNICEDVIFMVLGKDIRHGHEQI